MLLEDQEHDIQVKELVSETMCQQKYQGLQNIMVLMQYAWDVCFSMYWKEGYEITRIIQEWMLCPTFIATSSDTTKEVKAKVCLLHIGHKQENAFNRISKEMCTTIAAKLSQGVSMKSVMDYI